ncbi:hypothetical protein PRIPAC_87001 [Pristionchus pacificus]|uniref:Uncharacterized protein n=1 Tax=Pristionchus pacificus TaxID=54126 RepID=A0A2A6BSX1_PRIPA|nr:hypothetical protein PRIPAC_87001 [Pristionchus pacificus]|eukprot:PDM68957.1 hypothetical protein PRIPAC_47259 [Pristionchus pacificus]
MAFVNLISFVKPGNPHNINAAYAILVKVVIVGNRMETPLPKGQDEATNCMSMELAENGKLTADDLDECLSVAGWMENFGLKKLDAREYAADFRVRGYECRNEKFLKENFKCLYPTTQTRKADLDVCSAALREAIAVKGEACEAMDEYITCSREIFADECGEEVSSFVCNLVQTAMLFNYPMCRPASNYSLISHQAYLIDHLIPVDQQIQLYLQSINTCTAYVVYLL